MFVESSIKANALGATMTKRVKRIGCSTIKDLVEQQKLRIYDADTIIEMSHLCIAWYLLSSSRC